MSIANKIKKRISLVQSGLHFKDKLIIFLWLFTSPLGAGLLSAVKVKNKDGLFICRKKSQDLWMTSPYGEEELREYFSIRDGSFIDIGANVGKYCVMLGNKFKAYEKIIAIEPERENFETLLKNIELNKIERFIPLNIACFSKNTKLKLYISGNTNLGAHSIYKKTNKYVEVPAIRLDNLLLKYKIKKVDLIKIDVEGAESYVLLGAIKTLKKYHPKIIFEAWNEDYLEKCKKVLDKFGYKIKKIAPQNYLAY